MLIAFFLLKLLNLFVRANYSIILFLFCFIFYVFQIFFYVFDSFTRFLMSPNVITSHNNEGFKMRWKLGEDFL